MGIADLFGSRKKEKTPFKVPREVAALRTRISAEERENFPSMAHYKEIKSEAGAVYELLAHIIDQGEHADEAARLRDDIRKKMEGLEAKIKKNIQGNIQEEKQDYVEKNIDYLERKSTRDKAKTLFTEFLVALESFKKLCTEGGAGQGAEIDAIAGTIIKTLSELNTRYFTPHGGDKEIHKLREDVLRKIYDLNIFVRENMVGLSEKGLTAKAESSMDRILSAAKKMSEK